MLIELYQEQNIGVFGTIPAYTANINPHGLQIDPMHWGLWLALANRYAMKGQEVGGVMVLDHSNRILIAIPQQVATIVNVEWENLDTAVMIDGTDLPCDYQEIGTIHSHHSMDCSFSCTDDAGDLRNGHPTAFHIVSRCYPRWVHDQSICINGQRIVEDMGLVPDCGALPDNWLPSNLPILEYVFKRRVPIQQSFGYSKIQSNFEPEWGKAKQSAKQPTPIPKWDTKWETSDYYWKDDLLEPEQARHLSRKNAHISPQELNDFLTMYLSEEEAEDISLAFQEYYLSEYF